MFITEWQDMTSPRCQNLNDTDFFPANVQVEDSMTLSSHAANGYGEYETIYNKRLHGMRTKPFAGAQ